MLNMLNRFGRLFSVGNNILVLLFQYVVHLNKICKSKFGISYKFY